MAGWFDELVEAWFRHLVRRNRSGNTVRTYRSLISDLGRFLRAAHPEVTTPEQLTAEHLHAWQDDYQERHPHESTRSNAATAARSFLRWAAREELGIAAGLWDRVDQVEIPEMEPLTLEEQHVAVILSHYGRVRRRDLDGLRDRALFAFLLTTGARISEALGLDIEDLDRDRWIVRQKGRRLKRLVASERARAWLRDYVTARGPDDVGALWVCFPAGRPRRPMGQRDANRIWTALARELELPHFTNRFLRGTSGTEMQQRGASTAEAALHLGHRGLGTITRYTALRDARHQQLVDAAFDPLIPDDAPAEAPRKRRRRRFRVVKRRT